jgi:O-antigen/teichoic acid export membrane protein
VPEGAPGVATRSREPVRGDLGVLARGGTLNLAGMVLGGLLGFALVVVVTRGLGAEGAGVFFAAVALFMIASNVGELGADTGLVRTISRYRALDRVFEVRPVFATALWPVLATGAGAAALVLLLAEPLARVIFEEGHVAEGSQYLRLFAPFLLVSGASTVLVSGARGFGTMTPYVLVENLGKPGARVVLVLGAVLLGLGATWIALAWAVPVAVAFVAAVVVFGRLVRRLEAEAVAPPRSGPPGLAAEFWRFAAPRGLAGAFQVAITWLDVLLVSSMRTAGEAGVYAAVSRLVVMGTLALQAVRLALAPQLSGLLARDRKTDAENLYRVATWWLIAASWPLYLAFATFAPFVLGLFGPEFGSGQHVLLILSLAMLVNLGTGTVTAVLLMGGKSVWNLFNTVGAVVLNVGLNLWLIPRLGIEGAAIAWTASIVFDNVAALLEVRFLLGLRPFGPGYWKAAAGSIACVGAVGLAVRAAFGLSLASATVALLVALALYVPLLWRLRGALHLDVIVEALFRARANDDGPGSVRGDGILRAHVPHRAPSALRSAGKRVLRSWGVLTSRQRILPDFLVIGAKRGGTTSLFDYLLQHPNVSPLFPAAQRIKGVRYFDVNHSKGEAWYRSHFPTRRHRREMERQLGGPFVSGEASPYYLFHPLAPERAHRIVPDVKLVAVLRDPVDRAYSHYRERVRHGAERLTFEEAIEAEPERMRGELEKVLRGGYSFAHEHHTYLAQGEYAAMLEAWLALFPRERLLVLRSEDMFQDAPEFFRRVQEFLELPVVDLSAYGALNYHPGAGMDPATRERLRELFAPHNGRLAELLDLEPWRYR